MDRSACHACQVEDLFAEGPNSAHLLNDPFLLHASQKLHPFKGQYFCVDAFAENGEYVKLQGTKDSTGRAGFPA